MAAAVRHPLALRGLALSALAAVAAVAVAIAAAVAQPGGSARLTAAPQGGLDHSNSENGVALLSAQNMLPGELVTGTVKLENTGEVDGTFSLSAAKVNDSPGAGGGTLSDALLLLAEDITKPKRPKVVYNGPLSTMKVESMGDVDTGDSRTFRLTAVFPDGAGDNQYQGSSASLDLVWKETEAAGGDVKSERQSGGDGSDGSGDTQSVTDSGDLPFTGFPAVLALLLGALLIGSGRSLRKRARP